MVFFEMGLIFVGSGLIFRFGLAHAATLPFDCAQGKLGQGDILPFDHLQSKLASRLCRDRLGDKPR